MPANFRLTAPSFGQQGGEARQFVTLPDQFLDGESVVSSLKRAA
jgi:hypothetical protein